MLDRVDCEIGGASYEVGCFPSLSICDSNWPFPAPTSFAAGVLGGASTGSGRLPTGTSPAGARARLRAHTVVGCRPRCSKSPTDGAHSCPMPDVGPLMAPTCLEVAHCCSDGGHARLIFPRGIVQLSRNAAENAERFSRGLRRRSFLGSPLWKRNRGLVSDPSDASSWRRDARKNVSLQEIRRLGLHSL